MSGMVIDFSLTWLFKDVLHVNKFLANAIGFSAAVMSNAPARKIAEDLDNFSAHHLNGVAAK